MDKVSMEKIVQLCKARGFVFPGSEIYGGMANSWDYGPLGVELKNNVKQAWWKKFVQQRLDMVGIDAALIMNPKVWEASGHLATFSDPLVECKECHERYRADQIDLTAACVKCGRKGTFTEPVAFNMMMQTYIGPVDPVKELWQMVRGFIGNQIKSITEADEATKKSMEHAKILDKVKAYFRPETAQAMFVDFPLVLTSSRKRVPFGIAQIGKAFRNEITPGNYIFRQREFEQMEIEYFIHPSTWKEQFEAWLTQMHEWIAECGIDASRVHNLEVPGDELAHYSQRTVDIEFDFPFGKKELYGIAYRTDFDLKNHGQASGKEIEYVDPVTNEKYVPHVIEPSFGVDRTILAMLTSAYDEEMVNDEVRVVLRFPKHLAPIKIAILPLSKKDELSDIAKPLAEKLAKYWRVDYDETQGIGKRYRRQDEIGTPYCITVDFETLNDFAVTVRDRDTMQQERIAIDELVTYFQSKFAV